MKATSLYVRFTSTFFSNSDEQHVRLKRYRTWGACRAFLCCAGLIPHPHLLGELEYVTKFCIFHPPYLSSATRLLYTASLNNKKKSHTLLWWKVIDLWVAEVCVRPCRNHNDRRFCVHEEIRNMMLWWCRRRIWKKSLRADIHIYICSILECFWKLNSEENVQINEYRNVWAKRMDWVT